MSNSISQSNAIRSPGSQLVCRPAQPNEVAVALRLVLGSDGYHASEQQVADFLNVAIHRNIHLSDLWLAEIDGWLMWAMLPILSPGRTILILGASARFAEQRPEAVGQTIEAVCKTFASRDVQLAQVLIDPSDQLSIGAYEMHGFKRMAELNYLQRPMRKSPARPIVPAGYQLENYSPATHADFAKAIVASYEKSLDCPALNGIREIEDIIAGHKSSGEFDPADWFLLKRGDEPAGVLLLSRTIQIDSMELVYLGLMPEARRKGLGEFLLRLAEARVGERKLNRISLAVDSLNTPAIRLYYRHGMQKVTSKVALMRELKKV